MITNERKRRCLDTCLGSLTNSVFLGGLLLKDCLHNCIGGAATRRGLQKLLPNWIFSKLNGPELPSHFYQTGELTIGWRVHISPSKIFENLFSWTQYFMGLKKWGRTSHSFGTPSFFSFLYVSYFHKKGNVDTSDS